MIDWKAFLTCWSKQIMQSSLASQVEPSPRSDDWLGFEPATKKDIAELEQRLAVALPPSYKSFLRSSNGWLRTTSFIGRIRPTQEVDWFCVENERWAEVYAESGSDLPDRKYYDYGEEGAHDHRAEHLFSLLQISDVDDGVYLLNPMAVGPDGEWEAWFFSNWIPGAVRYPSFAHLMLNDFCTFARQEGIDLTSMSLPQLALPKSDVPRKQAAKRPAVVPSSSSLETLIEQLCSQDDHARTKAVRVFGGKLKGRYHAKRRPDLIPLLVEVFNASNDSEVRAVCVAALTELAEDGAAPKPLFDSLSDPDPGVVLSGIFALTYFPNPAAVGPLCRFVESRANVLFSENAMSALGNIGDEFAVPVLAGVLLDTNYPFEQGVGTAALALAKCGPRGFDVLVSALDHKNSRVRYAAVVGLDVSGDPRATTHLDRMMSDCDSNVAGRAKVRMGNCLNH